MAAIEAWKAGLEEKWQVVNELATECERVLSDYNNEVTKHNQEMEARKARLELKKLLVEELAEETNGSV